MVGLIAITGTAAWLALVLQLVLLLAATRDTIGAALATLQFFSYFTILSNLLVALVCTFTLVGRPTAVRQFFTKPRVRGGVALYIAVTGGIYFTVLRHLWQPEGAQWVADALLHYVVPFLYLMLWLVSGPRGLAWSDALRWLLFPLGYFAWTLARGAWLGVYPYPFMDVGALGFLPVLRNVGLLCALFLIVGLSLIAVDKALARRP